MDSLFQAENNLLSNIHYYKSKIIHSPFKHLCIDNLFDINLLRASVGEFPDLTKVDNNIALKMYGPTDAKYAANLLPFHLGMNLRALMSFFQSSGFILFIQNIFEINEPLIPDPCLLGGGLHQIERGGFLKMHTDFNLHPMTKLSRRINVLLYLNEYWHEKYGGHLELWDASMNPDSRKKYLPLINRMIIFPTNDFTPHGHPDPLNCPNGMSRKSLAFYYYSNGRPDNDLHTKKEHSTLYKQRPGEIFAENAQILES